MFKRDLGLKRCLSSNYNGNIVSILAFVNGFRCEIFLNILTNNTLKRVHDLSILYDGLCDKYKETLENNYLKTKPDGLTFNEFLKKLTGI